MIRHGHRDVLERRTGDVEAKIADSIEEMEKHLRRADDETDDEFAATGKGPHRRLSDEGADHLS
jgi:hypothetical protein